MSDTTQPTARTPEQIEADLEATRKALTNTVDELVAHLQPAHLLDVAKEDLGRRFADAKEQACATVDAAREGNSDALKKVGIAAAAAVGVVSFLVWRFSGK